MTNPSTHSFEILQGELPEWLKWTIGNKENKKIFYRILFMCDGLLDPNGFALPMKKLATECRATRVTIGRWLDEAIAKRFLVCTSISFVPKQFARRYRAAGRLAQEIRTRINATVPSPAITKHLSGPD